MKVKIGDKIYDSKEQPIMVILCEEDWINLKNMPPKMEKYCSYPDGMDPEDVTQWMNDTHLGAD